MNQSLFAPRAAFPRFGRVSTFLSTCAGFALLSGALSAGTMPKNLGGGLDALVESNAKIKTASGSKLTKVERFNGYASQRAAYVATSMIQDGTGRVLVRVHPNGIVPLAKLQTAATTAAPSLVIHATDPSYHGAGVFEAFVAVDDVPALAALEGVSSLFLEHRPLHTKAKNTTPGQTSAFFGETLARIGTAYDFGVTQHRVDQISRIYNPDAVLDYEGRGISVAAISDSFDASSSPITASTDVADGDLPGAGNKVNGQPVVVFDDLPPGEGTDEARAMLQTIYKMAPQVRLGVASGDYGEVDFANTIRAMAGILPGYYPASVQQGFKADVITDDLVYFDEPFFQDGIIAQGVNDAAAAGVSYFSSAQNNFGVNGYDSAFRFVSNGTGLTAAAGNTALKGTNINLAGVPAGLYAGGFHNFNTGGLDVSQPVNFPSAEFLETNYGESSPIPVILQWNDPDDTTTPGITGQVGEFTGTITYNPATQAGNAVSFPVNLTADQQYYFLETPAATPTTPGANPLDGQITLIDPNGNVVSFVDNGGAGAPESLLVFAPVTGTYTVTITAFEIPTNNEDITDGGFTLDVYTTNGTERITQNLSLLVFDANGNYLPADSATADSTALNSPVQISEFLAPDGASQVQFVIARSNQQPTHGRAANHLRYLCLGDGITPLGPAQYFNYLTPVTFGHATAAGANGVAAYAFSRPSLPEAYTSPGPATIYFDANNNTLATPEVRLKPDVAAMDGANTSFFGGDASEDVDYSPNFYGTSDAAPHAAAIAALVLEANGGSGKVTPLQMKQVLEGSAFTHDLDPYFSSGTAKTSGGDTVTVTIVSDNESGVVGTTGTQDPSAFKIQYTGKSSLATFQFNPTGQPITGGNVTGGNNGLYTNGEYFQYSTPGIAFGNGKPFTLGVSSPSLVYGKSVRLEELNVYNHPTPVTAQGRFLTLKLDFAGGTFASGDFLHFTIGRYELVSADVTTKGGRSIPDRTADLFGGGVSLPDGTLNSNGMTFSGTTYAGETFNGVIKNKLGQGYSPLDGFGFINAEAAVVSPLP